MCRRPRRQSLDLAFHLFSSSQPASREVRKHLQRLHHRTFNHPCNPGRSNKWPPFCRATRPTLTHTIIISHHIEPFTLFRRNPLNIRRYRFFSLGLLAQSNSLPTRYLNWRPPSTGTLTPSPQPCVRSHLSRFAITCFSIPFNTPCTFYLA